jgi:hypothetical protein
MTQWPDETTLNTATAFQLSEAAIATLQNSVAREIFGVLYSELSTDFKADLTALEHDAFHEVTQLIQWYLLTDTSWTGDAASPGVDLPIAFNELFRVAWLARAYRRFRSPETGATFRQQHVVPIYQQLSTFFDPNFATATIIPTDTVTYNSVARTAIARLIRQRTPVVPPFHEAQRTIRNEFIKLWKAKRWTWRVRFKQITITSEGAIEFPEGDTDNFDGFASKHIHIRNSAGLRSKVYWLDSERFANAAANYFDNAGDLTTGLPEYFYDESLGDQPVITCLPKPDQAYFGYANVVIGPPNLSSDSTNDFDLEALPFAFQAHLQDRIFAILLSQWGKEDVDASRALRNVEKDYLSLTTAWEDKGAHRYSARGHHQQRLVQKLASYTGNRIVGQLD